jgi:excisionase family DNA binding protein
MATKTKPGRKPPKRLAVKNGVPEPVGSADVLTLAEAAAYLRVSEDDVVNLVHTQGLAGRQIGTEWRFLKSQLQSWLSTPLQKSGNEALLALAGVWKDDPDVEEMLEEIYKQRGRPMLEEDE